MLKYFLIGTFLLPLATGQFFVQDPEWMEELKRICQGAEEKYYVDRVQRKCCKCSPCYDFGQERRPECDDPRNCVVRFPSECVYDDQFDQVFPDPAIPTTYPAVTTTTSSISANASESSPHTSVLLAVKDEYSGSSIWFIVPIVALVFVVIILVLIILIKKNHKKQKIPCVSHTLARLKQRLCKNIESSPEKSQNSRSEEATNRLLSESINEPIHCIKEGRTVGNASPPRSLQNSEQLSRCGPREMLAPNLGQNITSADDDSSSELSPFSSMGDQYGNMTPNPDGAVQIRPPYQQQVPNNDLHVRSPAIVNSGGRNLIVAQAADGAHITIQNLEVHFPPESRESPAPRPGYDHHMRHDHYGQDSFRLPGHQVQMGNREAMGRPCFPTQNTGPCVTNVSPPLMRQHEDANSRNLRRQSSEISSFSTGPVENGSSDDTSEKWQNSEPRRDQDFEFAICRRQVPSAETGHSRSYSNHHEPVQHHSRCVVDSGTRQSSSRQDSSISISHPPVGDLGLLSSDE